MMMSIVYVRDDVLRSPPAPLPRGEGKFVAGALIRIGAK